MVKVSLDIILDDVGRRSEALGAAVHAYPRSECQGTEMVLGAPSRGFLVMLYFLPYTKGVCQVGLESPTT